MASIANATEAEREADVDITPEMIEAGFKVFARSGLVDEPLEADKLFLAEIYRAMASCAYHSCKHSFMSKRTIGAIKEIHETQKRFNAIINSMTHEQILEYNNRPRRIIEEADAAPSFSAPVGEPCYPNAIDNDGMRYFAPLLLHRSVNEVRVGGIPWNRSVGQPGPGEWVHDRFRGVIQLGGKTGHGRVIAYLAQ